ncbi:Hpy99I family type II restriction endonuclease [Candidatus Spongiihabitans sp.]|uniref:Hpy99I family type II restriction endonuclease n=1 Tax=Candidatus Spongiihabitans sp. TaxID=3101308 RepID=UPI003C7AA348
MIKLQSAFQPNQHDSTGKITTRPSCKICRRDIDRKPMTAAAMRKAAKHKPKKGTLWKCPICQKQCIVDITAKVVLDHRHSDGTSRAFLCDSCNTGLGRFKNGESYLQNAITYLSKFEKK